MYRCIQEITKAFDGVNIRYHVDRKGDHEVLVTTITTKVASYKVLFVKTDESGNDVGIRIIGLASYPEEQWMDVYKLINRLQQKYRFAKFLLDEDGDLMVNYDFPVSCEDIGRSSVEMVLTLAKVLDEVYPELKRLQWA